MTAESMPRDEDSLMQINWQYLR